MDRSYYYCFYICIWSFSFLEFVLYRKNVLQLYVENVKDSALCACFVLFCFFFDNAIIFFAQTTVLIFCVSLQISLFKGYSKVDCFFDKIQPRTHSVIAWLA